MNIPSLTDPGRVADVTLAGWAGLIFFKIVPSVTAVAALVLLLLRIAIAVQEYTLNRRKMRSGK